MECYKPKSNIKDSISCLFLHLFSSSINDDAFMQPCKNLFRHILTHTRIDTNKSEASVEEGVLENKCSEIFKNQ